MPDIDGQPDKYEILTYETQPGDIIIHVRHVRPCAISWSLFQPCMTDIYLHIDARMANHIRTHP